MSDAATLQLVIVSLIRFLGLTAGVYFGYLGYDLFRRHYFQNAGELQAKFGEHHFHLKAAAPGTFFAVLGCIIASLSVARSITVNSSKENSSVIAHSHGSMRDSQDVGSYIVGYDAPLQLARLYDNIFALEIVGFTNSVLVSQRKENEYTSLWTTIRHVSGESPRAVGFVVDGESADYHAHMELSQGKEKED